MARALIRRIARIGDYRAFQSWSAVGTVKPFARVNVFYGTNGSGKSTLASLFFECSDPDTVPARADLRLDVELDGENISVTERDQPFWARMRVFNAQYVHENLRFDDEDGPRSDSLLTLGKPNVQAAEELQLAQARVRELVPAAKKSRSAVTAAARQLETRLSQLAREIVDDLRQSPVATYRGTNTYTKASVRKLLQQDPIVFDGASVDVAADRTFATASPMRAIPPLPAPPPMDGGKILARTGELLREQVTVEVLENLRGHPDRASWVQAGIPLHEDENACLFCGNELTDSRRRALAAHFDDALTNLQEQIDRTIEALNRSVLQSQAFASAIPGDGDLYPELAGQLRAARSNFRDAHDRYTANAKAVTELLGTKRANPFATVAIAEHLELATPAADEIEAIVRRHAELRADHDTKAGEAARRVELARVRAFADEYRTRASGLEKSEETAARLEGELDELSRRIITLQNTSADPVPTAETLTRDVERLLGRGDLQFHTTPDGKHYRIQREGAPATHLSEGERTAIALLHFLASIRREVTAGDEPIVVIDDPVSSLDDGILFGISSFLWSALVVDTFASQLLLFTHNFELFRQWIIQLDNARRHLDGKHTVHEIRMRYQPQRSGPPRRVPQFDPWTEDQRQSRRLRSLYHYLFARVATAVVEAAPDVNLAERMDLLALAPNAARKMMEAFLGFRYPQHIGDFHAGMREAMNQIASPSTRVHVERYLHAYSHNEEGNVSAMLDPSEATTVIRSIFSMMRDIDAQHFSSMCDALLIDETELLTAPGRTI